MPTFGVSSRASSSPCSSTSAARRRRRRARSAGVTARQAGKAARAAATAASVSSTPAGSSSAIVSSVAGLRTAKDNAGSAPLAVGAGRGHEPLEECCVLALLRVPEDAEREALRGVIDTLECAVVGPRRLAQALAEPAEALVVVRLHRRALADEGTQPAFRVDADSVVREDAERLAVLLVADDLRQVLDEVAAAGDVEDLAPATDGQHGHVARQRGLQQREFGLVALGVEAGGLTMRLGAVGRRVDVVAAREEEAVERVEGLPDRVGARRHEQWATSGLLDRAHVCKRNQRGRHAPMAPTRLVDVRRDSDERLRHGRERGYRGLSSHGLKSTLL